MIFLLICLSFSAVSCSSKKTDESSPKVNAEDSSDLDATSSKSTEIFNHKFSNNLKTTLKGSDIDSFKQVITTNDNIFVLGTSISKDGDFKDFTGTDYIPFISKFNTNGEKEFTSTISNYKNLELFDFDIDEAGNIVLLGKFETNPNGLGGFEGLFAKINKNGSLVFEKVIKDADIFYNLETLENGNYLVSGRTYGLDKNGYFKDMPKDNPNFFMTFDSEGNMSNISYSAIASQVQKIVKTSDGGFILGTVSMSTEGNFMPDAGITDDYVVIAKFDKSLQKVWSKSYCSAGSQLNDLVVSNDNIIALTHSISEPKGPVLLKINSNGEEIFKEPLNLDLSPTLSSIAVDKNNNIFAIGTVVSETILGSDDLFDYTSLLKFDSNGKFLFGEAINLNSFIGADITISSNNEFIVVGESTEDDTDATFIKFKEK